MLSLLLGDPTEAMLSIANLAAEPFTSGNEHMVESNSGHLLLKQLVKYDAERLKNASNSTSMSGKHKMELALFLENIRSTIKYMITWKSVKLCLV